MATESVLTATHLHKSFGRVTALQDVSLTLHRGEVLGFIGPNGAGKSTTIRILLGLLKADGGQATLLGHDVWRDAAVVHQSIAYVPGDVYLWPNMTGRAIIDLLLKLNHQAHTARTDELIRQFELDPAKKARTYSKGNRQKVALVAALSTDAAVYIFDEPTSGLDPLNEAVFQQNVQDLKRAGKSILLSSHILSEVEHMGDTIAIIRAGQIIETGSLASMQHLTWTVVTVQTETPLTDLAEVKGVHHVQVDDPHQSVSFAADNEALPEIMQYLAAHQVTRIESAPPTLEDLFLRYYKEPEAAK